MADLEFKKLSLENWQDTDPMLSDYWQEPDPYLRGVIDLGPVEPLTAAKWVQTLLGIELNEQVPAEIVELFEVARGAMLYGYFFYPAATLGAEQGFRVAEAAVRERCKTAGISLVNSRGWDRSFGSLIDDLVSYGVITAEYEGIWKAVSEARNAASHPKAPQIFSPLSAITLIVGSAFLINQLFCQRLS